MIKLDHKIKNYAINSKQKILLFYKIYIIILNAHLSNRDWGAEKKDAREQMYRRLKLARRTRTEVTEAIIARHNSVRAEIQWRGVQRDAMVVFGFTIMGVAVGSIDKLGLWIMGTPLPLIYLAAIWFHHDQRIGWLAYYMKKVVEPAMQKIDGLIGLDQFLDKYDPSRSFKKKYHFTSVMNRLLFPTLMGIPLCAGVAWLFHQDGSWTDPRVVLVIVAGLLCLGTMGLTGKNVRHIRPA